MLSARIPATDAKQTAPIKRATQIVGEIRALFMGLIDFS